MSDLNLKGFTLNDAKSSPDEGHRRQLWESVKDSYQSQIWSYLTERPVRYFDIEDKRPIMRDEVSARILSELGQWFIGLDEQPPPSSDVLDQIDLHSRYAILSHRWQAEELALNDMQSLGQDVTRKKKGFKKFKNFCKVSIREYGCRYVWLDTVCINQEDIPERDESIPLMFKWYQNAHVCIVYCSQTKVVPESERIISEKMVKSIRSDPWFTRGWTLQEFLAPDRLKFYGAKWIPLQDDVRFDIHRGVRDPKKIIPIIDDDADGDSGWESESDYGEGFEGWTVEKAITEASGVLHDDAANYRPGPKKAVEVFQWVGDIRHTTKPEDVVYSLLGLLDIKIPLSYGEGMETAFYRLQVECAKRTFDRALFHWHGQASKYNSMFSNHFKHFKPEVTGKAVVFTDCFSRRHRKFDQSLTILNDTLRIMITTHDVDVLGRFGVDLDDDPDQTFFFSFRDPGNGDTHTFFVFTEEPPSSDRCKLGVLGADADGEPVVVMLVEEDQIDKIPIYKRIVPRSFCQLPPLRALVRKPPEWVLIK